MHLAPANHTGKTIEFDIYLDHSSIELFVDGGRRVMTDIFFPSTPFFRIELVGKGNLENGQLNNLERIWD